MQLAVPIRGEHVYQCADCQSHEQNQMLPATQHLRQLLRLKYQALGLESSESRFQILSFLLDDQTNRTEVVATAKNKDEMGRHSRYDSEDTKKWPLH